MRYATGGTALSRIQPKTRVSSDTGSRDPESAFVQALRSRRPAYRLDDASFSDPLTTAISWFTGTQHETA